MHTEHELPNRVVMKTNMICYAMGLCAGPYGPMVD